MCVGPPWTRRTRWWRIWSLARLVWAAPSGGRQPLSRHGSPRRPTWSAVFGLNDQLCHLAHMRPMFPEAWPKRFGVVCSGGCDASSSYGDEATYRSHMWNALLATTVHFSTGVALQAFLTDEEMAKVALSNRFACDAFCVALHVGRRAQPQDGCSSASEEAVPLNLGNPLQAAIVIWQRGRSAEAVTNVELARVGLTCRFAVELGLRCRRPPGNERQKARRRGSMGPRRQRATAA